MQLVANTYTYWILLKGLSLRQNYDELAECLQKYQIKLMEDQFLDVLLNLGSSNNYEWLLKVLK